MSNQELEKDSKNGLSEFQLAFSPEQLKDLCKMLSILSKFDALTIFLFAGKGIKAERGNPAKMRLSKKQYYTRLKQLVDSGLIKKHNGSYFHTTMGKFVYEKHIVEHLKGASNAKQMRMIDALKEAQNLSEEEISRITNLLVNKE